MPAKIADRLKDPPPDQIYLETSFLIDAVVKPKGDASTFAKNRHRQAINLLQRLQGKKPRVVISPLLFAEFWDALLKIELKATYGDRFHEELRRNSAVIQPHYLRISEADEALKKLLALFSNRYEVDPVRAVHAKALSLMERYPLRSYDAVHIASGLHANVNDFAASDKHFEVVDGITIWRSW